MAKKYRLKEGPYNAFGRNGYFKAKLETIFLVKDYNAARSKGKAYRGLWEVLYTDSNGKSREELIHGCNFEEIQLDYIKILKKTVYGKKI